MEISRAKMVKDAISVLEIAGKIIMFSKSESEDTGLALKYALAAVSALEASIMETGGPLRAEEKEKLIDAAWTLVVLAKEHVMNERARREGEEIPDWIPQASRLLDSAIGLLIAIRNRE